MLVATFEILSFCTKTPFQKSNLHFFHFYTNTTFTVTTIAIITSAIKTNAALNVAHAVYCRASFLARLKPEKQESP
jgi:hypothetical protein